jgi:hypothetical protein
MPKRLGAMGWPPQPVAEAERAGQLRLELPLRSVDKREAMTKQAKAAGKRRQRRRAKQPGVFLP